MATGPVRKPRQPTKFSRPKQNQPYRSKNQSPPIVPPLDIPVGRRLAHFVEQWGELTQNKWVLILSKRVSGFHSVCLPNPSPPPPHTHTHLYLQFVSLPPLLPPPPPPPPLLREEITELLQKWSGKGTRSRNSQVFAPGYFLYPKRMESYAPQ